MLKKIQLLLFSSLSLIVTTGLVAAYFMNAYSDEMNRNLLVTADAFSKRMARGCELKKLHDANVFFRPASDSHDDCRI